SDAPVLLTANGAPVAEKKASLTVGPRGPMLLQDFVYLDEMSHFGRERIPERAVHAKGAGAFGYFEVTHDISKYCKAKVFSSIGKRTPIAIRFSTAGGESGSADTVSYFERLQISNDNRQSDQGIKNLLAEKASELSASDPDYSIRDLYNAIAKKQYPSWTVYIQVMTNDQAKTFRWNPFDLTKVWPHKEYPLIPVGKLVLDRNPENYFADVEQMAFNPAHMVPGIEPSPDKMLQGRLFAYGDTHRHRLGPNHLQLPVNCPYKAISAMHYQRDGNMSIYNHGGAPNYYPNSFSGPKECPAVRSPPFHVSGDVDRYNPEDEDDFGQATTFWKKILDEAAKERLVQNMVGNLRNASVFIVERAVRNFARVDVDLAQRLTEGLRKCGIQINALGKSANL
ncbi:hypothetical protein RF55_10886, partial [Lasius niger]